MIAAVRMVQRNALVYRRIWRGSVFSSFLQPTLFLIAMGLGLGTMVDAGGALLPGGVTLRRVSRARPARRDGHAGGIVRVGVAGDGQDDVASQLRSDHGDADARRPTSSSASSAGSRSGLTTVATAFVLVMTAFGIPRSPLVILAIPAAVLTGLAFAAPIIAFAATLKRCQPVQRALPLRHHAAVPVLRRVLPVSRLPEPLARAAWFTPLFHGVELVRGFTLDAVPPAWPIHVALSHRR